MAKIKSEIVLGFAFIILAFLIALAVLTEDIIGDVKSYAFLTALFLGVGIYLLSRARRNKKKKETAENG